MNEGKKFEKDFENSIPQYTWYYRIKDSSSSWSNSNNSRFTQKSPCDYIIFKGGKLYLLELKSHNGKSIPLATIAAILGHAGTRTTDIYITADINNLKECVLPLVGISRKVNP